MPTTLIVRDATLAVNGAPEKRGEPREHLRTRVAEVKHMDARTAEECVEVLTSVATGEGADPEALQALMIVALAHPVLAERMGLPALETGRRLAARLERGGDIDRTLAVLELLQEHFPGHDTLERDLAQLMRRAGMVKDLVSRYFERARRLIREGRHNEAAGWLREVLQLDPKRKDAARLMRDLRIKRVTRSRKKGGWLRFLFLATLLCLGGAYAVLRELRLRAEFQALPSAASGNLPALKRRLADLEEFISRHPLWHGGLQVLAERSELRVQLAILEERERAEREAVESAERERLEAADLCRERGLMRAQAGDARGALEALREAVRYGGPEWPHFQKVSQDISDLESGLAQKP
jgi:tetratricopeptide (TPR) repeat protein